MDCQYFRKCTAFSSCSTPSRAETSSTAMDLVDRCGPEHLRDSRTPGTDLLLRKMILSITQEYDGPGTTRVSAHLVTLSRARTLDVVSWVPAATQSWLRWTHAGPVLDQGGSGCQKMLLDRSTRGPVPARSTPSVPAKSTIAPRSGSTQIICKP
jgi:hypothetical protein